MDLKRFDGINLLTSLDPGSASITLAKIQNPMKSGFDKVNDDLKKVHKGQSSYGKALDKVGTSDGSVRIY